MDESDRNLVWYSGEKGDQAGQFPLEKCVERQNSHIYRLFQQNDGQAILNGPIRARS
jgi:hypothetical protein